MNRRIYRNSPLFVLAAFALLLGACSNETMTEMEDEHAEPEGVHLVMNGSVFRFPERRRDTDVDRRNGGRSRTGDSTYHRPLRRP